MSAGTESQRLLADVLCTARRAGKRLPLPALSWSGFSVADALAVQRLQAEHFNWFPDGHAPAWKLGGSPATGRAAAPVPGTDVLHMPWQCPPGYAVAYGIEAELAVRLGRDLAPGASEAEAWQAIDCFFPCIELCDTRFDAAAPLAAELQLADQQSNRAILLGPAVRCQQEPDWVRLAVAVHADGKSIFSGIGSHPFVNPLSALPWLAQRADESHDGLRAGDIIATGTMSGIHWAAPGEQIRVTLAGFGCVELEIPA